MVGTIDRFAPQRGRAMSKAPASPGLIRRPVGRPGGIFPPPSVKAPMVGLGGGDMSKPFPMPGRRLPSPPVSEPMGPTPAPSLGPSLPPPMPPPPPSLPPTMAPAPPPPTRDVEASLYDDAMPAPPPPPPRLPPEVGDGDGRDGGLMGRLAGRGGIRKPTDDFTY